MLKEPRIIILEYTVDIQLQYANIFEETKLYTVVYIYIVLGCPLVTSLTLHKYIICTPEGTISDVLKNLAIIALRVIVWIWHIMGEYVLVLPNTIMKIELKLN